MSHSATKFCADFQGQGIGSHKKFINTCAPTPMECLEWAGSPPRPQRALHLGPSQPQVPGKMSGPGQNGHFCHTSLWERKAGRKSLIILAITLPTVIISFCSGEIFPGLRMLLFSTGCYIGPSLSSSFSLHLDCFFPLVADHHLSPMVSLRQSALCETVSPSISTDLFQGQPSCKPISQLLKLVRHLGMSGQLLF